MQLLWHEVVIESSSDEVLDALAYMNQRADNTFPPKQTMTYVVESTGSAFSVLEEGDVLSVESDASHVLDVVYRRVHQRAFELASLLGWIRVHAALVTLAGGRVLAVGPSGVGKTTLASRLLFDGTRVHGDESVVLRNGRALAVARPFHLKPGIDDHVPELRPHWPSLPYLEGDPPIRAFDPTVAGFPWTIDDGPVHHVVVLERGDDLGSALEPMSATAAMPLIVDEVFRNQEPTRAVVAEVAALLRSAVCWRLRIGDPAGAAGLLQGLGRVD